MLPNLPLQNIIQQVQNSLSEDIGHGDISASLVNNHVIEAKLISRETAILCGSSWFEQCFLQLDPEATFSWSASDSDELSENQQVCLIRGKAQAILTAERSAINFLQTLSAVATVTNSFIKLLSNTSIKLLDTRKTIPGLRVAQKYAVKCGGGYNHRHGLYDGVLLKENHIIAAGGIDKAIENARNRISHGLKIEIEVETLSEVEQALDAKADILLLDNMSIEMMENVIRMKKNKGSHTLLEASGNMNEDKIIGLRQLEIDFISVGAVTKNIQSIDFSLRFLEN
ncbi:MAG: carboxylating nicotinate-nucleotide diphosphorylase [Gammaproteobacteria bacterium]|nr:carboxylating nicotinate-nucleotide diphosphorylase [Gammaproteobacteria bacterium]